MWWRRQQAAQQHETAHFKTAAVGSSNIPPHARGLPCDAHKPCSTPHRVHDVVQPHHDPPSDTARGHTQSRGTRAKAARTTRQKSRPADGTPPSTQMRVLHFASLANRLKMSDVFNQTLRVRPVAYHQHMVLFCRAPSTSGQQTPESCQPPPLRLHVDMGEGPDHAGFHHSAAALSLTACGRPCVLTSTCYENIS